MFIIKEAIVDNIDLIKSLDLYLQSFIDVNRYKRQEIKIPAPKDYGIDITYQSKDDAQSYYTIAMYDTFFKVKLVKRIEVRSVSMADPKKNYQSTSARSVQHKKISLTKQYSLSEVSKFQKDVKNYFNKEK